MDKVTSPTSAFELGSIEQFCRKRLFAILNRFDKACFKMVEQGETTILGNPHAKQQLVLTVEDPKTYKAMLLGGSIGAGEAYVQGHWRCDDLTLLIQVFCQHQEMLDSIEAKFSWLTWLQRKVFHRNNRNTQSGSKKNIIAHYDLGNDLYESFLDDTMMYSSAIFPSKGATLLEAQTHKLDTICQQLELTPSDHLLEIGTGWGGLAIHAAKHYGCNVTTTTISEEQYKLAKERVEKAGLTHKIELLKQDYRELDGQYDKLVSIEMIEAVGEEFMNEFFTRINERLKTGGKGLIQAITIRDQRMEHYRNSVDFIQRYIFPGGFLPSVQMLANNVSNRTDMLITNLKDIGLDYARTLELWRLTFNANLDKLDREKYDDAFVRLWNYYFCYCEGAFKERAISTVQLTLEK